LSQSSCAPARAASFSGAPSTTMLSTPALFLSVYVVNRRPPPSFVKLSVRLPQVLPRPCLRCPAARPRCRLHVVLCFVLARRPPHARAPLPCSSPRKVLLGFFRWHACPRHQGLLQRRHGHSRSHDLRDNADALFHVRVSKLPRCPALFVPVTF
jgi:hypothetical protein